MKDRGGDITHFGTPERSEYASWETEFCNPPHFHPTGITVAAPDWELLVQQAIEKLTQHELIKSIQDLRLDGIDRQLRLTMSRLRRIELSRPLVVPIESFAPEPYELIKPFHVVLESSDAEFIATFFDANVSASGETEMDALANLKDMILAVFEALQLEKDLGPGPAKQLSVLKQFIKKVD
jgi:predicted RNase H-like HicB family nuclease